MSALMAGQAIAGVLASATNLRRRRGRAGRVRGRRRARRRGDGGDDGRAEYAPSWFTFGYFLFTAAVFGVCVASAAVLRRLPVTQHFAAAREPQSLDAPLLSPVADDDAEPAASLSTAARAGADDAARATPRRAARRRWRCSRACCGARRRPRPR